MKHIQYYINENLQNDLINEGKILQAIKSWFKKLFEPTDKQYDRFRDHGQSIKKHPEEYKELINKEFDFEHIVHGPISYKEMNEQFEIYKGYDIELNKDHKYYEGFWVNAKVRDCIYLADTIELKNDDTNYLQAYEILQILIKDEFKEKINIEDIINILLDKYEKVKYNTGLPKNTKVIIKEKTNKDIYNIAINKCKFQKDEQNGEKIAYYEKDGKFNI